MTHVPLTSDIIVAPLRRSFAHILSFGLFVGGWFVLAAFGGHP